MRFGIGTRLTSSSKVSDLISRIVGKVRALALALFFAFILSGFSRSSTDPFQGFAIVDPPFPSLSYGIQAFLWWNTYWASIHLEWIRLMNFGYVKQIFAWDDLEPARGQWVFTRADQLVDEIHQKGLRVVVRLSDAPDWTHPNNPGRKDTDFVDGPPDDVADMATYCGTVATRYKGRITAYQIWNEPNLTREWGNRPPNAQEYVNLLGACSQAIRAADPAAILISAGLAPTGTYDDTAHPDDVFLQAMYDVGFQQYIDVVGVHAAGYTRPTYGPNDAERDGKGRWATFRRPEDLRMIMIRNGDAARQMAVLELGWTTDTVHPDYAWYAVTRQQQAQFLVGAYQYAATHWRPWVGLMSAIYIDDPSWTQDDEEYWWGITTPDGYTMPAYFDLANMAKYCGDYIIPARAPDSPEALGLVRTDPCP
jgi:polysaccharide biosynthesis protein PslG